jgi:hypothetical protein
MTYKQRLVDIFYKENGAPCCAGCDYWRWFNVATGECIKSSPVSSDDRAQSMGISGLSFNAGSGFPITDRADLCGDFKDDV